MSMATTASSSVVSCTYPFTLPLGKSTATTVSDCLQTTYSRDVAVLICRSYGPSSTLLAFGLVRAPMTVGCDATDTLTTSIRSSLNDAAYTKDRDTSKAILAGSHRPISDPESAPVIPITTGELASLTSIVVSRFD